MSHFYLSSTCIANYIPTDHLNLVEKLLLVPKNEENWNYLQPDSPISVSGWMDG